VQECLITDSRCSQDLLLLPLFYPQEHQRTSILQSNLCFSAKLLFTSAADIILSPRTPAYCHPTSSVFSAELLFTSAAAIILSPRTPAYQHIVPSHLLCSSAELLFFFMSVSPV
jgi:hypothetical protein